MSFCGQAYESVKIRRIRLIRVLFHFAKNFYMFAMYFLNHAN